MNKIGLYIRCLGLKYPLKNIPVVSCHFNNVRFRCSKKPDEENPPAKNTSEKGSRNEEAVNKLNLLLQKIVEEDVVSSASKLKLAKPKPKRTGLKQKKERETDSVETQTVGKEVLSSVKNVAESFGGNVKQTESELLSKLLNSVGSKSEAKALAVNLSDIVKGMQIDRTKKGGESISRAQQVRNILYTSKQHDAPKPRFTRKQYEEGIGLVNREKETINLFGEKSLGIFSDISQYTDNEINTTWKKLYERDLRLAVTHPPEDYFQQMILWTEQGKLWKFPIDNEQDMEEEKDVYFAEHIFLEKHLEPWCPPKGPIRHFMELVCVGLSKNPYMNVQRKQEHIAWYRDYFHDKEKLLEEVGAIPADIKRKQDTEATTQD